MLIKQRPSSNGLRRSRRKKFRPPSCAELGVWRFLPSQGSGLLVVPGAVLELSLRGRKKVGAPPPRSVWGELASVFKLGSTSPNSLLSSTFRLLLMHLPNRATSRLEATSVWRRVL